MSAAMTEMYKCTRCNAMGTSEHWFTECRGLKVCLDCYKKGECHWCRKKWGKHWVGRDVAGMGDVFMGYSCDECLPVARGKFW
jgi:hypothetical protein